jgi:hypothetical protein
LLHEAQQAPGGHLALLPLLLDHLGVGEERGEHRDEARTRGGDAVPVLVDVRDRLAREEVAQVLEFLRAEPLLLERLELLGEVRERLLVLLPLHELEVLLLVHAVQEVLHAPQRRAVAELLHLRPLAVEDRLLYALAPLPLLLLRPLRLALDLPRARPHA